MDCGKVVLKLRGMMIDLITLKEIEILIIGLLILKPNRVQDGLCEMCQYPCLLTLWGPQNGPSLQ